MKVSFRKFLRDQRGITAVEYALIASLIAIVIITAVGNVGTSVSNMFNSVASSLP